MNKINFQQNIIDDIGGLTDVSKLISDTSNAFTLSCNSNNIEQVVNNRSITELSQDPFSTVVSNSLAVSGSMITTNGNNIAVTDSNFFAIKPALSYESKYALPTVAGSINNGLYLSSANYLHFGQIGISASDLHLNKTDNSFLTAASVLTGSPVYISASIPEPIKHTSVSSGVSLNSSSGITTDVSNGNVTLGFYESSKKQFSSVANDDGLEIYRKNIDKYIYKNPDYEDLKNKYKNLESKYEDLQKRDKNVSLELETIKKKLRKLELEKEEKNKINKPQLTCYTEWVSTELYSMDKNLGIYFDGAIEAIFSDNPDKAGHLAESLTRLIEALPLKLSTVYIKKDIEEIENANNALAQYLEWPKNEVHKNKFIKQQNLDHGILGEIRHNRWDPNCSKECKILVNDSEALKAFVIKVESYICILLRYRKSNCK